MTPPKRNPPGQSGPSPAVIAASKGISYSEFKSGIKKPKSPSPSKVKKISTECKKVFIPILVIGVLIVAIYGFTQFKNPTQKLREKLKTLPGRTLVNINNEGEKTDIKFSDQIEYDIQKTDSVVSPLISDVKGSINVEGQDYSFQLDLAYQDNKWIVKNSDAKMDGGEIVDTIRKGERVLEGFKKFVEENSGSAWWIEREIANSQEITDAQEANKTRTFRQIAVEMMLRNSVSIYLEEK